MNTILIILLFAAIPANVYVALLYWNGKLIASHREAKYKADVEQRELAEVMNRYREIYESKPMSPEEYGEMIDKIADKRGMKMDDEARIIPKIKAKDGTIISGPNKGDAYKYDWDTKAKPFKFNPPIVNGKFFMGTDKDGKDVFLDKVPNPFLPETTLELLERRAGDGIELSTPRHEMECWTSSPNSSKPQFYDE